MSSTPIDGAFFVDLAPVISADLVIPSIAKTLSVQEANRPILDSLKEYLRDRRLLLVLDNFEHVLPTAAQVADLLSTCPRLKADRVFFVDLDLSYAEATRSRA